MNKSQNQEVYTMSFQGSEMHLFITLKPFCSFHRPQWQIFLPFHIPEDGKG